MANRERGEFTLKAGDQSYILRLTTNACCELEDFAPGRNIDQVMAGFSRGSRKDLILILWTALRDKHADIATEDQASLKAIGGIVDEAGGMVGLIDQMVSFIDLNSPEPEQVTEGEGDGKKSRPRKARSGAGGGSSRKRSGTD